MLIEHCGLIESLTEQPPMHRAMCRVHECYWTTDYTYDYDEAVSWLPQHHFYESDEPVHDWDIPFEMRHIADTPHNNLRSSRWMTRWGDQFGHDGSSSSHPIRRFAEAEAVLPPELQGMELADVDPVAAEYVMNTLYDADPYGLRGFDIPTDEYDFEARALVRLHELGELTALSLWAVLAANRSEEPAFGPEGAACWDYLLNFVEFALQLADDEADAETSGEVA